MLVSLGLFLGPPMLVVGGAFAAAESQEARFLGATIGLGVGMVGAVVLQRLFGRAGEENA